VLLEDRLTAGAQARLYSNPVEIVRCEDAADALAALARIEAGVASGLHAAGFFSYELGYLLEPRLARRLPAGRDAPLIWFGLFGPPRLFAAETLDAEFAELGPPPTITDLAAGHDRAEHVRKVTQVLDLIRAGDLYQANLTFPMRFRYAGDPLALYAVLRARQPVAHGGVVATGETTVLSVSPELFFEVADGQATTRPMKGTAARHADSEADAAARVALIADPKQRAENLMIVDLLRNDLARIAKPGTVRAPALFTPETYPTFHALTSTVTGKLRPDVGLSETLAALFPCGSIVGAPKIRAMEALADLEARPRSVYTGAIGAVAPGGDMAFNVAIRTAVIGPDGVGRYGVGGGVVADSDPAAEYDEALLKARVLSDLAADYGLIETFRWSADRGFVRLAAHLDRLSRSARKLGFAFDRDRAEADLARRAAGWSGDQRVRLLLSRSEGLTVSHEAAAQSGTVTVTVATGRLDAGDPFLRHKTTRREAFDAASAEAVALSADEALLLNRRGVVADAARHSVFVEAGGRLVTPPLTAGALPGVLRASLIEEGAAVEGEVTLEDLRQAPAWFVGNSLHGLRRARRA
jgi:para-aminobenzoate synthetase/4-amino-4-deoxychorismate lyase